MVTGVSPWLDTPTARRSLGCTPACATTRRTVRVQACQYTWGSSWTRSTEGVSRRYSSSASANMLPSEAYKPALIEVVPASIANSSGMLLQVRCGGHGIRCLELLHDYLQCIQQALGFLGLNDIAAKDDTARAGGYGIGGELQGVTFPGQFLGAQGKDRHRRGLDDLVEALAGVEGLDKVGAKLGNHAA